MQNLQELQERWQRRENEKEIRDDLHCHCMSLAAQLRGLPTDVLLDALHEMEAIAYRYRKDAERAAADLAYGIDASH